jgi:hypothetical protein
MVMIKLRPAIAMIELIFAIVIIGIVLMSAPTLIGVANQSTSTASSQESITEVSSLIKLITTRYWDENDFNNTSPILHTANPIPPDEFPGRVSRKQQHLGNDLNATDIGQEANNLFNDMDDFNGRDINMTLTMAEVGVQGRTDYTDFDAILHTQVQYGRVAAPGNEPFSAALGGVANHRNTKIISVNLTSPNFNDKNITLSTFSCNIGSYTLRQLGANR